jgi:ABC-type transport system involved in multi-copper enzyme maturation permease subunit
MITAAVVAGFCLFATLSDRQIGPVGLGDVNGRIEHLIYGGTAKGTFATLSIFLGLGGLLRERVRRTVAFTLALPVSRLQVLGTQIGVGLLQLGTLSFLPVLLLPLLSRLAHDPYPISKTLHYSVLWFVCSMVIFAFAHLLSVSLEGEYTAPVACYIALMLQALIASWTPLRPHRLNLMWTMAEFPAIPWERLLTLTLIAFILFALAAWRTQKQDF